MPAPWFRGAQAAWAGEAPPSGIHLSFPLGAPAEEGAKAVTLRREPPRSGAGLLQAGALVNLIRPDSRLSELYTVQPDYKLGNVRVPLNPRVRGDDEGAENLKTADEPVPEVALGHRIQETWSGGYAHLSNEADVIHAVIPISLPGSHVRLGWGNASSTIGGMGYES